MNRENVYTVVLVCTDPEYNHITVCIAGSPEEAIGYAILNEGQGPMENGGIESVNVIEAEYDAVCVMMRRHGWAPVAELGES